MKWPKTYGNFVDWNWSQALVALLLFTESCVAFGGDVLSDVLGVHKITLISGANFLSVPLHRQAAFRDLPPVSLPHTDAAAAEILSLPIFPELREEQIQFVVDQVRQFA
jgi:dTDP-4-amino-4,6-dideoxygalactose transaminase